MNSDVWKQAGDWILVAGLWNFAYESRLDLAFWSVWKPIIASKRWTELQLTPTPIGSLSVVEKFQLCIVLAVTLFVRAVSLESLLDH